MTTPTTPAAALEAAAKIADAEARKWAEMPRFGCLGASAQYGVQSDTARRIAAAIRAISLVEVTEAAPFLDRHAFKEARLARHMTQEQFSAALGITASLVTKIERGERNVSDQVLHDLRQLPPPVVEDGRRDVERLVDTLRRAQAHIAAMVHPVDRDGVTRRMLADCTEALNASPRQPEALPPISGHYPTPSTDAVGMREALEPFAACCEYISDDESDEEWAKFRLLIKDYRRARAALSTTPHDAVEPSSGEGGKAAWRIAGHGSHFGPFVVVDGVPHDQVVLCYWRNQIQPVHLRLPGQAYVADLLRLMDRHQCCEVAIIPARHQERVSIKRADLERLATPPSSDGGKGGEGWPTCSGASTRAPRLRE